MGLCSHLFLIILMICGHLLLMFFLRLGQILYAFLVSFEGLGALGSDVGVQGRFLVKNGLVIRQKSHPLGGNFSMFFSNFFDTVFEWLQASKIIENLCKSRGK